MDGRLEIKQPTKLTEATTLQEAVKLGLSIASDGEMGCKCKGCDSIANHVTLQVQLFLITKSFSGGNDGTPTLH